MTPVWSAKGVGLCLDGLKFADIVAVICQYRNKHGQLVFPDVYMDSIATLEKSRVNVIKKGGKLLTVVPFEKFTVKLPRHEFEETYPGLLPKSSEEVKPSGRTDPQSPELRFT